MGHHESGSLALRSKRRGVEDRLAGLLEATLQGSRAAEVALLRELQHFLQRHLERCCSPGEVEDMVQGSLLCVHRALGSFRGDSTLSHFAILVAERWTFAQLKRARRRTRSMTRLESLERALLPPVSAPDAHVLSAERRRAIGRLLDTLPTSQAEALISRVLEEESLEEISARSGTSANTIRSRVRLARRSLKLRIASDPALRKLLGR